MVKARIKNVYESFVKGNLLIMFSSLGFTSFLSLIVLLVIGIIYYLTLQEYWALLVFGVITIGFAVLCLLHYMSIPILARNDEYFSGLATMDISVNEDTGLYIEGYDGNGKNIRTFTVYWDDINKVTYLKNYFAIQCYGNEMIFIENKKTEYVEGNAKTLEYYLKKNIDRRPIKIKETKIKINVAIRKIKRVGLKQYLKDNKNQRNEKRLAKKNSLQN